MMTPVGGDEAVDRQQAEVGRAVDEDVVVVRHVPLDRFAQDLLASEGREQLALGRCEIDVRWCDVDARDLGRQDDVVERRPTVGEDVGHRAVDGVEVDAKTGGEIRLRVHVDAQDSMAFFGEGPGQVDRRRRLADAALLIRDRDHMHHRGITSNPLSMALRLRRSRGTSLAMLTPPRR